MGRKRACLPFVLLALAPAALAPSASAAGWLAAVDASPVNANAEQWDLSLQDVAVDGHGNTVAVWVQPRAGAEVVESATRPVGGSWSGAVPVSGNGEEASELEVVAGPQGDAAAIWIGAGGGSQVVRVATRPAGGAWSTPVALSNLAHTASAPDLAVADDGALTAVWCEAAEPNKCVVRTATRPAGGAWSDPVDLSDDDFGAAWPEVAVDPEGNATALWVLWDAGRSEGTVQSKSRPAGGDWSSEPVAVSGDGGLADRPSLAVDAQGDATAIWQRRDRPEYNGYEQFVQTARRVDGAWGEPAILSEGGDFGSSPTVTVDPAGNATALWLANLANGNVALQSSARDADGSWGDPVNVTVRAAGLQPSESDLQLEADPQGNVTALWTGWLAPNPTVRAAHRTAAGAWSGATTLSTAGSFSLWPRIAVAPQGYATVVWSGFGAGRHAVRSRVLDAVGPELDDLAVPAQGVVGEPVAMSVAPRDVWSPVTTSWDLGDGATAAGAAIAHCYRTPGTRAVTVTGTDAAANSTSASRAIEIAANPSLPAGADPCSGSDPDGEPGPDTDPGPDGDGHPDAPPIRSTIPRADPPPANPVTSRACLRAKQGQRQLRTKVRQAKRKQRAAATRVAKRRWRAVVKRRQVALRKATRKVGRACR